MTLLSTALAGVALLAAAVPAAGVRIVSQQMGPAKFMWPHSRGWSPAVDNTGPCGAVTGVVNRTKFPLQNGRIALLAQTPSMDAQVSISYLQEPLRDSDFQTLIAPQSLPELDMGHTCVPVADAPPSVKPGTNATLQIKYTSEFDKPNREVFYACADITYVELTKFDTSVPCFNATRKDATEQATALGHHDGHGDAPASQGGKKLAKGVIAGIVVGSCAGVAAVVGLALMLYRSRQRRLRAARQEQTARGVKWEGPEVREASHV